MLTLLINVAYDIAKKEYENKHFTFNDLWKKVTKFVHLTPTESSNEIGNFYLDIMQDTRFVYIGNNKWQLKEYISLDDIDEMKSRLYDFENTQTIDDSVALTGNFSSKVVSEEEMIAESGYSDIDENIDETNNISSSDEEDEE